MKFIRSHMVQQVVAGLLVLGIAGSVGWVYRHQIKCRFASCTTSSSTSSGSGTSTTGTTTTTTTTKLTTVSADSPGEYIFSSFNVISDTISFASLRGDVSLAGHILRATDDRQAVTFTDAGGIGNLVESGHGIRLGSSMIANGQVTLDNQTGSTGTITVTVDNIVVFMCPPASDPNNRQVSCTAP